MFSDWGGPAINARSKTSLSGIAWQRKSGGFLFAPSALFSAHQIVEARDELKGLSHISYRGSRNQRTTQSAPPIGRARACSWPLSRDVPRYDQGHEQSSGPTNPVHPVCPVEKNSLGFDGQNRRGKDRSRSIAAHRGSRSQMIVLMMGSRGGAGSVRPTTDGSISISGQRGWSLSWHGHLAHVGGAGAPSTGGTPVPRSALSRN
jgi:hypothetical protein